MTYTIGTKGAISGGANFPNNLTTTRGGVIPDTCQTNNSTTSVCSNAGGMQNAMSDGSQVLVQMPDGTQRWCVFDGLSTFNNPILVPVGP